MRLWDGLDPESRRTVRFFTARLLIIVLAPLLLLRSEHPFETYIGAVLVLCLLCTLVAVVAALVEGDRAGPTSLNHWDEALAYGLVAALARAAAWAFG